MNQKIGDVGWQLGKLLYYIGESTYLGSYKYEIVFSKDTADTNFPEYFKEIKPLFTGRFWHTATKIQSVFNIIDFQRCDNKERLMQIITSGIKENIEYAIDIINTKKDENKV